MTFLRRRAGLSALLVGLAVLSMGALYGALDKENNLSDLESATTAVTNLGFTATAADISALSVADALTFANISNSSAIDETTYFTAADTISLELVPSATAGDTDFFVINANQVDDANATDDFRAMVMELTSESGDAGDTFTGLAIEVEEGTANTIIDAAISIDNAETTASTLTDAIIVTSSGVAAGVTDAIDASAANIVNAINVGANLIMGTDDSLSVGATDDTVILDSNDSAGSYVCTDADANANCSFAGGGTGTATLGAAANTSAAIVTDGGTVTIDGSISVPGDITAAPESATTNYGGNAGARNQFIGLPKLSIAAPGVPADGTAGVAVANPLLANCSAIVNGAEADDTTNYVTGSSSYKYTFASTAAENDGIDCVIAYPNAAGADSLGFWFRTDTAIASGDLVINLDDGGVTDGSEDFPAVTVVDEWQWIEVDFNTDCAADCEEVDGIEILVTAQAPTNLNDVVINIDQFAMWIATSETAIGDVLVDGVLSVVAIETAAGSANTGEILVEWTNYFVNYQSGADAIVAITDENEESIIVLQALQ